jgi:hypothetical protein
MAGTFTSTPKNSSITHAITHKCHFYMNFYFIYKSFMPFDFVGELFSVEISCSLNANFHTIYSIPMQFADVLETKNLLWVLLDWILFT